MPAYRSRTSTHGRNMAGARGLWRVTGMKDGDFGKPIIAAQIYGAFGFRRKSHRADLQI